MYDWNNKGKFPYNIKKSNSIESPSSSNILILLILVIQVWVNLHVKRYGSEMSWRFISTDNYECKHGPFGRSGVDTRWCLLKPGSYTIHCDDSYGDAMKQWGDALKNFVLGRGHF